MFFFLFSFTYLDQSKQWNICHLRNIILTTFFFWAKNIDEKEDKQQLQQKYTSKQPPKSNIKVAWRKFCRNNDLSNSHGWPPFECNSFFMLFVTENKPIRKHQTDNTIPSNSLTQVQKNHRTCHSCLWNRQLK